MHKKGQKARGPVAVQVASSHSVYELEILSGVRHAQLLHTRGWGTCWLPRLAFTATPADANELRTLNCICVF
jgi:hypothetical protein